MWTPDSIDELQRHPDSTFLLSLWHELFHAFTPDSSQPRLHNVSSLVEELVDMARRWKHQPKYQHQIETIAAELGAVILEEHDLLSHLPAYRTRVLSLCGEQNPDALIAKGRVALEEHENYCGVLFKSAEASIASLPKHKKHAYRSIRRLATLAMQAGKEDDDVWDTLNQEATRDAPTILKDLIALSTADPISYQCTLSVIGDVGPMHSIARKQGLTIVPANSLPEEYTSKIEAGGNRILHVQKSVEAESIRAAVAKARAQLELEMGLVSLYANPTCLRLHGNVFVRQDDRSNIFAQSEQAFRRLHARTKPKVDINESIELIKSHTVDRRVISAVGQLSIASASTDTRTKFVNLWASIETLAGAHEAKTAMERVSELIVPLVVSRSVHRTTRYLAILTQKLGDEVGDHDLGPGFRNTEKRGVRLDDMLTTLSSPHGDPRICGLLRFAEHPLLRFRIYTAWERLHNPKALLSSLEASK